MSLTTKKTFDAATVVALKMLKDTRRLEIQFVDDAAAEQARELEVGDDAGVEHVVSLPVPAAVELARLTLDASEFLTRLKEGPGPGWPRASR